MASHSEISEFLYSNLNISVSGLGPFRESPLDCYKPIHQSYYQPLSRRLPHITSPLDSHFPGGSLRTIDSSISPTGAAVVFDRDIVTTWRLPSPMAAYEIYF